jgi:excisionase family DNA binding protein
VSTLMPQNAPGRSNKLHAISPSNGRPVGRRYAKVDDAADYVQVTGFTIRKLIRDGKIHAYRIGSHLIRVDLNELDAVMAGEDVGAAS